MNDHQQKEIDRTFLIMCQFTSAHYWGGAILAVSIIYIIENISGTTPFLLSILVAITTAMLLISTIFFGFLSEKLTKKNAKKNVLIVSEAILFTSLGLAAFAQHFIFYSICLAISSFAGGAFTPLAVTMVAELYPPEERGNKYGVMSFWNILGAGGGILFGAIFNSFLGPLGWRITYVLIAFLGFLNIINYYHFGIEPERGRVEPEFHDFEGNIEYDYKITFEKFKRLFKKRTVAGILIFGLISSICIIPLGLWTLYYFSIKFGGNREVAMFYSTLLIILTGFGNLFGNLIGGKIGDKLYKSGKPRRRVALVIISVMGGSFTLFIFYMIPFNKSTLILFIISWTLLLIIGFFSYLIGAFAVGNYGAIYSEVCTPEERSTINSIGLIMNNIGGIIGHLMVAVMLQDSLSNLSMAIILLLIIYICSSFILIIPYLNYSKEAIECRELMKTRRKEIDAKK